MGHRRLAVNVSSSHFQQWSLLTHQHGDDSCALDDAACTDGDQGVSAQIKGHVRSCFDALTGRPFRNIWKHTNQAVAQQSGYSLCECGALMHAAATQDKSTVCAIAGQLVFQGIQCITACIYLERIGA